MAVIPHIPILLGAYYYTWYGIGEQWSLYPRPWQPTLGEYRSADRAVMEQHHKWAKLAGIGKHRQAASSKLRWFPMNPFSQISSPFRGAAMERGLLLTNTSPHPVPVPSSTALATTFVRNVSKAGQSTITCTGAHPHAHTVPTRPHVRSCSRWNQTKRRQRATPADSTWTPSQRIAAACGGRAPNMLGARRKAARGVPFCSSRPSPPMRDGAVRVARPFARPLRCLCGRSIHGGGGAPCLRSIITWKRTTPAPSVIWEWAEWQVCSAFQLSEYSRTATTFGKMREESEDHDTQSTERLHMAKDSILE
jgi:hypothetical protein